MSLEDFTRLQEIKAELGSQIEGLASNFPVVAVSQDRVNRLLLEALEIISYELIDLEK